MNGYERMYLLHTLAAVYDETVHCQIHNNNMINLQHCDVYVYMLLCECVQAGTVTGQFSFDVVYKTTSIFMP